jgi:hypothetical protein
MPLRSPGRAAALAAAVLLSLLAPATDAAALCEDEVERTLQELLVPQQIVNSVDVVRRNRGGKSSSNYTLDAMVKLDTCSGNVVINLTRYCLVRQTYTTLDCTVGSASNN